MYNISTMAGEDDLRQMEDNINYKAILCEQIPELFLDKMVAKNHFSKFGKIKKFILRPKRFSCTIEYENKDDAKNACMNAGNFNGIDFIVNYAEREVAHVQNTEEWVDPEVQAELEAMSPGNKLDASLRHPIMQKSNMMRRNTNSPALTPKSSHPKTVGRNKQNSPQPEFSKLDSIVRQEIDTLLKTPAFTDEEKYRVLDARDKLIRMSTIRQTDIKKARATKGTCPDMCPEKERLMREFQRQVSTFEMTEEEGSESRISHKKAIKEYSRSSADQEVPLSHELRSESVLQMTMQYLMHRIMALCDDPKTSLADWFHFVWDRTRSIRKDITQQELCSLGAVQLVEQCARFHIHCAARLVAEDPSVFDKKINAENLTKCLQTLKYMYHDLRIKGVECPCEAEFRSYIILLNLGDSNFLWEVKQLPEFIQRSVQIKRAISFYNALQNNNFVKFFSMIKLPDTSYLSACILLGYFTKLRLKAMDAIVKSHNWRKNDVYLPLAYLTNILGFDDETSAVNFFSHYGLQCDLSEKRVLLDRLIKPSMEYAMDRALQLVESKLRVSVGECIFGQTLPSASLFENHQPYNSFDSNGLLKIESLAVLGLLAEFDAKAKAQLKFQQEQPNLKSPTNVVNLFKMPTASPVIISPKQQKNQQVQEEQKFVNEEKEKTLNSYIAEKKDRAGDHSPFILNNTFSKNALKESPDISLRDSIEPVLKTLFSSSPSNTIFESTVQKPLQTMGNIFGVTPKNDETKSSNIFGAPKSENVNIFQQSNNIHGSIFAKGNALQAFQTVKPLNKINFFPTGASEDASKVKVDQHEIFRDENDNRNIVTDNNLKEIDNQFEYKEKLSDLKVNYKQQKDEEYQINKLKFKLAEKSEKITETFIFNIIDEEVFTLAQTELLSQTIAETADMQKELLITEVLKVNVEDIVNEEYAVMCYDQLLLSRYFSRWLMHLRKRKEQRKLIEDAPFWVTTDTRAEYADAIKHPSQQKTMEMIKRYRFGQPCDLRNLFKFDCHANENPLNLFALVGQHLLSKQNFTSCGLLQQRKYFKFLITLPGNEEELLGSETLLNKWLVGLIDKCQTETGPFVHGIEHNVALCVRKLEGIIPKNEQGLKMTSEGDHNDGIVCLITGVEINTHSRKRLYNLLKSSRNLKRIPLAIIAYNCNRNEEELAELLDLPLLQEKSLIHSYIILGCQIKRRDFNLRKLLIKGVNFITRESYFLNSNEIQALAMQNVLSFLESTLGDEMWQRWSDSTKRNPIFNKIFCLPEHVLGIYHKALDHLLHITQQDFNEMPEFPAELKEFVPENPSPNIPLGLEFFPANWKNKTERNLIKSFLQTLYMPDIKGKVPAGIEDLKLWLLEYTSECVDDEQFITTKASHEAITNLVHEIKHQCLQNFQLSASVHMINYLTVFKPIIFAHINAMLKKFKARLINTKVIYLKDDLNNYQTQPWWLNYEPINLVTIDYDEVQSSLPSTVNENKECCTSENSMDEIIAKAEAVSRKAEESISEFKRKKYSYRNSLVDLSLTSHLKRILDESLYHFELSKKVGQYDTSFATDLTNDIDKSISDVLSPSPNQAKRKRNNFSESHDQLSNINSVIVKATKLIENAESREDKKFEIHKMY